MFLKRDYELSLLDEFLSSDRAGAMVYGIRQVGKSSLILKALEGRPDTLYFECLDATIKQNMLQLTRKAQSQLQLPPLACDDIISFFEAIKMFSRPFTIVLDEYPYLKRNAEKGINMDSIMQSVFDGLKGTGIKVILCGSYVSDMKELLEKGNPLFNRLQPAIHLTEMDYYDGSSFYPDLAPRDKAAFHAVFGGHPLALSMLRPELGLEENIKKLFLEDNAPLRFYVEYILFQELRKIRHANSIMDTLGNRKLHFSEILEKTPGLDDNNLSRQLTVLLDMEAIAKLAPINAVNDRRKTFYTVASNLVRFYYTYIYLHKDEIKMLGKDAFFRLYIEPSLNTFISYRAREIARSYFSRLARSGKLDGVYAIGMWWYDDRKKRRNGEFDCVLRRKDTFDVWEVKYLKAPMTLALMEEERAKIQAIEGLNVGSIGFVSVSGFEAPCDGALLVTGEDLYAEGL